MRTDKMFKELKPGQKMRCNVQEIGNPYSEVVTATITIVSKKEGWVEYYYSDQPEKMRYSKFSTLIDFYNYKLID
jgi:hypothetical protein